MKKIMTIAIVMLMALTLGITSIHAMQQDMGKGGCAMMSKAEGMKCRMGDDGKCPMDKDKCPMQSHHHDEKADSASDKAAAKPANQ